MVTTLPKENFAKSKSCPSTRSAALGGSKIAKNGQLSRSPEGGLEGHSVSNALNT